MHCNTATPSLPTVCSKSCILHFTVFCTAIFLQKSQHLHYCNFAVVTSFALLQLLQLLFCTLQKIDFCNYASSISTTSPCSILKSGCSLTRSLVALSFSPKPSASASIDIFPSSANSSKVTSNDSIR